MPHGGIPFDARYRAIAFGSAEVTTVKGIDHADFGFSATELADAVRAVISVHGGDIHLRYDGGDPTTTVGHHIDASSSGRPVVIMGAANIGRIRLVKESGTTAIVSITLEKLTAGQDA